MSAVRVRAAYRAVLRAQRVAFRDDLEMIRASQTAARAEFDKGVVSFASGDPDYDMEKGLETAHEAAQFFRTNIVQAPLNERGNYEVSAERIRTDKK